MRREEQMTKTPTQNDEQIFLKKEDSTEEKKLHSDRAQQTEVHLPARETALGRYAQGKRAGVPLRQGKRAGVPFLCQRPALLGAKAWVPQQASSYYGGRKINLLIPDAD